MSIPTAVDQKINERLQGIADLIKLTLQDIYLVGYRDGIDYAYKQFYGEPSGDNEEVKHV